MSNIPKHCDDYIDDPAAPEPLRKFLARARMPAHGLMVDESFPELFATYNGNTWRYIKRGDRVRVVMSSRMGDVGITKALAADVGYDERCMVEDLTDFSESP
jgi:hypothetical protein